VHRTSLSVGLTAAVAVAAATVPAHSALAQQADLSISPFVSFMPASGVSPLAGLALTLEGSSGLALRASGHVAFENSNTLGLGPDDTYRPWGADADALLFIRPHSFNRNGYRRGFAPFVFAGVGISGNDSTGYNTTSPSWSYGVGATVPLGSSVDAFGESRWRMSQFVLPTANLAASPTTELRVGLTFHIGGGGTSSGRGPRWHDHRTETTPSSWPGGMIPYPVSTTSSGSSTRVIGTADQYIGTPYRYGGTSPASGFDCSGFTQYVFARQGVRLPRTAREQAQVGQAVSPDWGAVEPGDLVMFEENGRIGHVAIYAGNNRIIHSSASGGGVRYDDLSTQRGEWFVDHMVAARRITPDARGLLLDLARGFADSAIQLDGPDHAPRPLR
jgi:cell wall-associated NlpC family hydrolase